MTIAELVAKAQAIAANDVDLPVDDGVRDFARAVVDLLGEEQPCGWDPVEVVGDVIVLTDHWPTAGTMDAVDARHLMRMLARAADKTEGK